MDSDSDIGDFDEDRDLGDYQRESYPTDCSVKSEKTKYDDLLYQEPCKVHPSLRNAPKNIQYSDWIFLPSGGRIRKKTVRTFLMRNIFTHQYFGEVCFLHPRQKRVQEGMLKVLELIHPLTFVRSVGTQRKEASEEIAENESFTKFLIIIREINIWTRSLPHAQATLIYAAAEFIESSPYIAEYLGIIIFAVVSERIRNFPELEAFLEIIKMVIHGTLHWHEIMDEFYEDLQISDIIQREYKVARIFYVIMKLALTLGKEDDLLKFAIEESLSIDPECPKQDRFQYIWQGENPAEWNPRRKQRTLDDINSRRPISLKEMTHQACILANYLDTKLTFVLPLMAHMISRGYYTHHSQILAAVDYARPISGIRPIMMSELLNVIKQVKVSNNNKVNNNNNNNDNEEKKEKD